MGIRDSKGFSLVEIMITAAVMAIMMLAFSKTTLSGMQNVAYLEDKLSLINLNNHIQTQVASQQSCSNSVVNQNINRFPASAEIRDRNNQAILNSGNQNIWDGLTITNVVLDHGPTPLVANSTGQATLVVVAERQRSGGGPTQLAPIEVPVMVQVDNTGRVSGCSTAETSIVMLPSPVNLGRVATSGSSCGQIRNGTHDISNFTAIPPNATHAILRGMADINVQSGNAGMNTYVGATSGSLVRVISLDGGDSSSSEANASFFKYTPLSGNGRTVASRIEGRCVGSGGRFIGSFDIWVDGFLVAN